MAGDLLEVRKQFIELSGRDDLVVNRTSYADNGADFFIRNGQKFLDSRLNTANAVIELVFDVEAGDFFVDVSGARAIRRISIHHPSNGLCELEKKTLEELYQLLNENQDDFGDLEKGFPTFYAVVGKRDVTTPDIESETEKRVLFVSPADGAYEMRVEALVNSTPLLSDEDVSFWTAEHPMCLVWAALWALEVSYRNREGANDWLVSVEEYLRGIDADAVEEQIKRRRPDYAWGVG